MEQQPKLPTMYEVVDGWAKITVERLKEQLIKKNIGVTGKLMQSLAYNIIRNAEGDVSKAQVMFNYYGRFVDMGVGKGVKIGDRKELNNVNSRVAEAMQKHRRPKKWYSKQFWGEVIALSEVLGKHFGHVGLRTVESELRNSKYEITL